MRHVVPGVVWTVKDLVAVPVFTFEPRGLRQLKGVGEWPLYAVTQTNMR
jgi:hypothetical protein